MFDKFKAYFWKNLVAVDQLANTILGGSPDETISSRLGKGERRGCKVCWFFCRILDIFEKDHCALSIEEDESENTWGGSSGRSNNSKNR
jgi:hypothetical protein